MKRPRRGRGLDGCGAATGPEFYAGYAATSRPISRTTNCWRRETGSVAPQRRVGRRRLIEPAAEGALRVQVAAHADATLAEHCTIWEAAHGVTVSPATMSRALRRLGLPLKKNR